MNSIFDENSEFLKYLKEKGAINDSTSPDKSADLPHQPADTFVLDLKSHTLKDPGPVEEVKVNRVQANEAPPVQKPITDNRQVQEPKENNPKLKKLNRLNNYWLDKFRFVVVSGLIFVLTFVGLNWSAYSQVFYGWYLNFSGVSVDSPLNNFADSKDTAIASDLPLVDNSDVPKLDIEVTPPGTRIIIPRLQSNVPVISMSTNTLVTRNWDALENEIQSALRSGVVHYPGTPFPNQSGNVVLTGHSSYYPWDPGRFKDVFAILHQATVGDEIVMFYNQKKYVYKVTDIKKVAPTEVNVLGDSGDDRLTLITCTPIGTNLKRLIVTAKPVL